MIRIHQVDGGYVEIKKRKRRKSTGRKRGRPKKVKSITTQPKSRKQPYSIILTSRNKQKECIKTFSTINDAYSYFNELQKENKSVRFPVKHINCGKITEANYELYIIKKVDKSSPTNATLLRDEMGKLIEYNTNLEGWEIVDKCKWNIEETFWVYGYDPIYQRKTYQWIFDNFIGGDKRDYSSFKNVLVYRNKFIVDDGETTNIVFCKCVEDAYRLYNEIERECNDNRYKNLMFSGDIGLYSKATVSSWIDKLCKVTNFNRNKIKRKNLRP